jgi:hypothetical protein
MDKGDIVFNIENNTNTEQPSYNGGLVFYINKGILITKTETLDANHIAVEMQVGVVKLAGAVEFDGVMLEGKPETLKINVSIAVTAILNGPYSIAQLSDATG